MKSEDESTRDAGHQERPQAGHLDEYTEWKDGGEAADANPRDSLRKVSHIALLMSYDLIDKLRWWEKQTLALPDEEIARRVPHAVALLERLRAAYLDFADVDL